MSIYYMYIIIDIVQINNYSFVSEIRFLLSSNFF